jgi:hypothetical protein
MHRLLVFPILQRFIAGFSLACHPSHRVHCHKPFAYPMNSDANAQIRHPPILSLTLTYKYLENYLFLAICLWNQPQPASKLRHMQKPKRSRPQSPPEEDEQGRLPIIFYFFKKNHRVLYFLLPLACSSFVGKYSSTM